MSETHATGADPAEDTTDAAGGVCAKNRPPGRPPLDPEARGMGRSPGRQVRMPHDLNDQLKERAAAENRSVSEVIREAVLEYLRRSKRTRDDDLRTR